MDYNKHKHLKLLKSKSSQPFENSRKSLSDKEFFQLLDSYSNENFFELQAYSIMLISHLHWENREQYFELIEILLTGPFDFLPLIKKYRAINEIGKRLEAEVILLEPNPKSDGFVELIDELVLLCRRYCPDSNLRESHEFSEEDLRKLIQKMFITMKDRYP